MYGSNEAQSQLRLYESTDDAKLKKAYKDSVTEILAKMENERKVFEGTFKGESSESTEESLMKAAKSMLKDAEERNYSGRAGAKVASLKDQIEWVEKQNGGQEKDRVLLFQKMQGVNAMTQFY